MRMLFIIKLITQPIFLFEVNGFYYPLGRLYLNMQKYLQNFQKQNF